MDASTRFPFDIIRPLTDAQNFSGKAYTIREGEGESLARSYMAIGQPKTALAISQTLDDMQYMGEMGR